MKQARKDACDVHLLAEAAWNTNIICVYPYGNAMLAQLKLEYAGESRSARPVGHGPAAQHTRHTVRERDSSLHTARHAAGAGRGTRDTAVARVIARALRGVIEIRYVFD